MIKMAIDVFPWFDLSDGVFSSSHLVATLRIVSPEYVSPQPQNPL